MGTFIIKLPDSGEAVVRTGHVFRKAVDPAGWFTRWTWKRKAAGRRIGYIVSLGKEYRLLRSASGEWLDDNGEGGWTLLGDMHGKVIRKAIEEWEAGQPGKIQQSGEAKRG